MKIEDISNIEESGNKSSLIITSNVKKKPRKASEENNSADFDLEYLYGTRRLVAQVFHEESFEAGKKFLFVQFQELDLTEDIILNEVPAKINKQTGEITEVRKRRNNMRSTRLKHL